MTVANRLARTAAVLFVVAMLSVPAAALAAGNPGKGGGGGGGGRPGGTESVGNNLSNPVIFAEGVGLLGVPSDGTTGYQATWTGLRMPPAGNPTLPEEGTDAYAQSTWTDPNTGTVYYLQGTDAASWQASWENGAGSEAPHDALVKWGDNIQSVQWTNTTVIHVEVSMRDPNPAASGSYFPTSSLYGSGETETFGTTGVETPVTGANVPLGVYSEAAYLIIQPLDANHQPVGAPVHVQGTWNRALEGQSTGALTPEVNASGSVVYSYNWFTQRDKVPAGWYRLTFGVLRDGQVTPAPLPDPTVRGNVQITGLVPAGEESKFTPTFDPDANTSTLDIELVAGSSGSGGGSGNPGKGSGGGGGRPGGTESIGNNLSNPAIFAEGVGLLGAPSDGSTDYTAAWTGLRIPPATNPTLPIPGTEEYAASTWQDPNTGEIYYLQGTEAASWQASWENGAGSLAPHPTLVKWGDNIQSVQWTNTATIHLEVGMRSPDAATGGFYFPTPSLYGTGQTETFGTTGVNTAIPDPNLATQPPVAVYSEAAYLIIQPLDANHNPVGDPIHVQGTWNRALEGQSTGALTPEVNASGNIVYSYNWFTGRDGIPAGWYRLTFGVLREGQATPPTLPTPTYYGNADITGLVPPGEEAKFTPAFDTATNTSWLDIQLISGTPGSGSGGGGSGSGGGGGGGGGGHGGR